jgi:hypothetical protein
MQIAIAREALNGRYLAIRRAKSRNQAAMHRFPVEPESASPAIAGIAAFLDSEPAKAADKSSQTLARPRFGVEEFSVDLVSHKNASVREFLANLLGKIIGQMLAMTGRAMDVVEVEVKRRGVVQGVLQRFRGGHVLEAQLDRSERRGGDGQEKFPGLRAEGADQQNLRAS